MKRKDRDKLKKAQADYDAVLRALIYDGQLNALDEAIKALDRLSVQVGLSLESWTDVLQVVQKDIMRVKANPKEKSLLELAYQLNIREARRRGRELVPR